MHNEKKYIFWGIEPYIMVSVKYKQELEFRQKDDLELQLKSFFEIMRHFNHKTNSVLLKTKDFPKYLKNCFAA